MVKFSSWSLRSYWLLAALVCGAGLTAGSLFAISLAGAGGPTAETGTPLNVEGVHTDNSALELISPGSPGIGYPAYLRFGSQPSGMAFGKDGALWVASITSEGGLSLAQSASGSSSLNQSTLPVAKPNANPRLEVDDQGRLVIGDGDQILLVKPDSLEYQTFDLPAIGASNDGGPPSAIGTIVQLHVAGSSVFVSRYGTQSLTEVELDSGKTTQIDVPQSFGGYDDFRVAKGTIWLIKTGDTVDTVDGPPSQIGALDISSGKVRIFSVKVRAADLYGDGLIVLAWDPDRVVFVDSGGEHAVDAGDLTGSFLQKLGNSAVVADRKGGVWMADTTVSKVAWLNPSTGKSAVFALPEWQLAGDRIRCPVGADCSKPFAVFTSISAVAVNPNGDLYFADSTTNSIGVIPSQSW